MLSSPGGVFSPNGAMIKVLEILIPPRPIKRNWYRCDSMFYIQEIEHLYRSYDNYGIILVNGQCGDFFLLSASGEEAAVMIGQFHTRLQRAHGRGGQSQNRIARLQQESVWEYLKKLNDQAMKHFWDTKDNTSKVKGLILVGTGSKKDELLKGPLDTRLRQLVVLNTTCEAVDKSLLLELPNAVDPQWLRFTEMVVRQPDLLLFGAEEVVAALEAGTIKCLYVADDKLKEQYSSYELKGRKMNIVVIPQCKVYGGVCASLWLGHGLDNEELELN